MREPARKGALKYEARHLNSRRLHDKVEMYRTIGKAGLAGSIG